MHEMSIFKFEAWYPPKKKKIENPLGADFGPYRQASWTYRRYASPSDIIAYYIVYVYVIR
jgi:hypothetical protein